MARGVNLSFLADVRPFLKGTDDVQGALEDVGGSLDDLARDAQTSTRIQVDALGDVAEAGDRAANELTDDFRTMARQADTSFDSVRTSGDQAMTDLGTNSKGKAAGAGAEVGQEFAANIGEQIGSGQANIADILAGTLGGLVTIPGIGAAAAGLGIAALVVKGMVDGTAKAKEALQETIQTVFDSITVDASNLSIEWNRQKMLDDAIDALTEGGRAQDLQRVAEWVKLGIGEDTIAHALVGEITPEDEAKLQSAVSKQRKLAEDRGALDSQALQDLQAIIDLSERQHEAQKTANDLASVQLGIYKETKAQQEEINREIRNRPSDLAYSAGRYERIEKP
jgi:histone H3/H4